MFDEDADGSRARAEQGRKKQEFRELYESVKLAIKDEADQGGNSTTYSVSKSDAEFVDILIERLTEENYGVVVDPSGGVRTTLSISWHIDD